MHSHDWRVSYYLLLTLPDVEDLAERCVAFVCTTCGHKEGWTASWPLGQPIQHAGALAQAQWQEQHAGTPLARMARRQEAGKRPWRS